jgi:hypothetical protein
MNAVLRFRYTNCHNARTIATRAAQHSSERVPIKMADIPRDRRAGSAATSLCSMLSRKMGKYVLIRLS